MRPDLFTLWAVAIGLVCVVGAVASEIDLVANGQVVVDVVVPEEMNAAGRDAVLENTHPLSRTFP